MITRNLKYIVSHLLFLGFIQYGHTQEERIFKIQTLAFYNVENLFDTENEPFVYDDDRTPEGKDVWTKEKYRDKLSKLARVISEIGVEKTGTPPAIIGICEIENEKVLEDLINQPELINKEYGIIHFDSPDRRGIDVGLLYRKAFFRPINSVSHRLLIYDLKDPDKRVYTRDQLVIGGLLDDEKIYFIINHWPSRSGGEARSSYKREQAAALNKRIVDSIYYTEPNAKIISMGDFNDDPTNKSIKQVLGTKASKETTGFQELYNPMEKMMKKGLGTLAYRDGWNLFDQIILSEALIGEDYSSYQFYKAGIFNKNYLVTPNGQYRGYPFRSYGYGGYQGGFSDHFPVYIYLIQEQTTTTRGK